MAEQSGPSGTQLGVGTVPTPAAVAVTEAVDHDVAAAPTFAAASQPAIGEAPAIGVASVMPGARIHQYELVRELGRGGMGSVWVARDLKLGRRVAIKFLLHATAAITERFLIEARATAQCGHENIVVIYEVDEHAGLPYMVLEFLEGTSLREAMYRRGRSVARALEIALPVARALARAHDAGIVHRDLKPENIFVTTARHVKVLDFGIAKALAPEARPRAPSGRMKTPTADKLADVGLTREGAWVGTLPYMSPEQFGTDAIDHRTDLWALGIVMYELLSGCHPVEQLTPENLFAANTDLDHELRPLRAVAPEVPEALAELVGACLRKRKTERPASAREVARQLEQLMPGRGGRALVEGESPYPGLSAFQEADADRFFGRAGDVARMAARVREQPLTGVIGASGAGKSSFVRAGLGPALKASGDEAWEVIAVRPGRDPITALASALVTSMSGTDAAYTHGAMADKLASEPGYFGAALRARAQRSGSRVLLFVDQFEELYTLVEDQVTRLAFTAALSGVADDPASPLRVVVSMRSDLLDRVTEDLRFMHELGKGLVLLAPLDGRSLRDALVQPLELIGYRFEREEMIDEMLDSLGATSGALPLLQFTAAKLWDARDRTRRLLTAASYNAIGGITGALATHADDVLARMTPISRGIARTIFQRMITPDRTRAIVELAELEALGEGARQVVDLLVAARLLVVQSRGDHGGSVEIVHESLIERWPTLRRWLDEDHEDAAFVAQLVTAAKQWEAKGRPGGLLWRGEAMEEARRWAKRRPHDLAPRERAFLDAVLALGERSARRRRALMVGAFALLAAIAAGAVIALFAIRSAEREATRHAQEAAREAKAALDARNAESAALAAKTEKEQQAIEAVAKANEATAQAVTAQEAATVAQGSAAMSRQELEAANVLLGKQKTEAERRKAEAELATQAAEAAARDLAVANEKLATSLEAEKVKVKELEAERAKLANELH